VPDGAMNISSKSKEKIKIKTTVDGNLYKFALFGIQYKLWNYEVKYILKLKAAQNI